MTAPFLICRKQEALAIGSIGLQYTLCGQTTIKILQVENPLPTITSFTPDFMGALGEVVITGTNFYNISDIMFGGTDADSFVVDSNTKITAIVGSLSLIHISEPTRRT